jgi:hypothetical protein
MSHCELRGNIYMSHCELRGLTYEEFLDRVTFTLFESQWEFFGSQWGALSKK